MSRKRPRILLTNDDGYASFGIQTLNRYLSQIGHVEILAPKKDCSGYGSALSIGRWLPKPVQTHDNAKYLDGTPADCAYVGLNSDIVGGDFDILVSGVNFGDNLSTDIFSSGTIGAAMQGIHLRYPPVAVSLASSRSITEMDFKDFDPAGEFAARFVSMIFQHKVPWKDRILFNINIPDVPQDKIEGANWTRLAVRGPSGRCIFHNGHAMIGKRGDAFGQPGNDIAAINNNYISITPLHNNLSMEEPRASIFNGGLVAPVR